jgi:aspartyl-tRNA(Asn)/glutamyl-tRNA(Gln) amidotransferase subunit A
MESYAYRSAIELRDAMRQKEFSPVELVEQVLTRIAQLEPRLNSFVTVMSAEAISDARRVERSIGKGMVNQKLLGLPISVKDLIHVKYVKLTHGSKLWADQIAGFDSPVVERLRAAGAIIIGKTTTSEFGGNAIGFSPLTGVTRNPWDLSKTPGGSSAGAAASVAAGITPFAIGTDGGGSVRIPASLTGLVGLKPQFGRVPILPESFVPSLAHIGTLSRSVRDSALLLSVIAGHDPRDVHSMNEQVPDYEAACALPCDHLRIGWSSTLGYATPTPEILRIAEKAARVFEDLGCQLVEIQETLFEDPDTLWNVLFYSSLRRRLEAEASNWQQTIDPMIARSIKRVGNQKFDPIAFETIVQRINTVFENVDILITPTLPVAAFETLRNVPSGFSPLNTVTWAQYTYPFNLSGNPAISLPAGLTAERLPVGIQLIARPNREADLLTAASNYENARPWADIYHALGFVTQQY